jgi:hypothetical protein
MAVYTIPNLKSRINQYIKQNFNQEITGPIQQGILQDVVDSLNAIATASAQKEIRCGTFELSEGENSITHGSAFTAGKTYTLVWVCFNNDGIVNSRKPTNITVSGFKIIVDAACTLIYIATEN